MTDWDADVDVDITELLIHFRQVHQIADLLDLAVDAADQVSGPQIKDAFGALCGGIATPVIRSLERLGRELLAAGAPPIHELADTAERAVEALADADHVHGQRIAVLTAELEAE